MSMLPTKLHTWFTVHELISSLCAWHRRWLVAGEAFANWFDVVPGVWARFLASCCCCCAAKAAVAVGEGDALRFGLDSIFNRFALIGVDALKSSGDDGRGRLLFVDSVAVAVVWLVTDTFPPNDWLPDDKSIYIFLSYSNDLARGACGL